MTAILNGIFGDYTLTIPASTTFKKGTVLGALTETVNLAQFKSKNTDGSEIPRYVLAQDVKNDTTAAADRQNVRVLEIGTAVNQSLIFDGTDSLDTIVEELGSVRVLLKSNGIAVINGENVIGEE